MTEALHLFTGSVNVFLFCIGWLATLFVMIVIAHLLMRDGFKRNRANAVWKGVCSGFVELLGFDVLPDFQRLLLRVLFVFPWHGTLGWIWYLVLVYDTPIE